MAWLQAIKNATLNNGDRATLMSVGSSGVALTLTGVLQFTMAVVAVYSAYIAREYYKAKIVEKRRANDELIRIAQETLDIEKAKHNGKK